MSLIGLGQGPMADSCEQGNESLGIIKGVEFLNQLMDYQLLNEYSAS